MFDDPYEHKVQAIKDEMCIEDLQEKLVASCAENERLRKALRELIESVEAHAEDGDVPCVGMTRRFRDVLRSDKCSP